MPDLLKRRLDRPLFLTGLIQSLLSPEGYPSPLRSLDLGLIVIYLITAIISREPFCHRRGPPRNHDLGSRRLTRRVRSFTLLSTSFIAGLLLLLIGVSWMMLGVLGEYLWRTLEESRGRPQYIIESSTHHAD